MRFEPAERRRNNQSHIWIAPDTKPVVSTAPRPALFLPHLLAPLFSRATPFPKVTVLFCRLPLLTLCPKLEAFHLWNLMRIMVRRGRKINQSKRFLWNIER